MFLFQLLCTYKETFLQAYLYDISVLIRGVKLYGIPSVLIATILLNFGMQKA